MKSWKAVRKAWIRPAAAVLTALVVLVPSLTLPAVAQSTATFTGTVFDPSGAPVQAGFKVVLRDVKSGAQYTAVTNASGAYNIPVPIGGRYKLESAVAPDGTVLPVQNVPPIAALVPGTNRVDVKFSQGPPPVMTAQKPATPPPPTAAKPTPRPAPTVVAQNPREKEKKKKGAALKPWWKRPGPIIGIVLGSVVVVALVAGGGGGGSKKKASASSSTD
jgi:Carboxypeptidase regulatory-like domain